MVISNRIPITNIVAMGYLLYSLHACETFSGHAEDAHPMSRGAYHAYTPKCETLIDYFMLFTYCFMLLQISINF
jgi:hypothetical protein